jgi:hypothetical protein
VATVSREPRSRNCRRRIKATIDWLVDAIPNASARAKIFGTTARELYFKGK